MDFSILERDLISKTKNLENKIIIVLNNFFNIYCDTIDEEDCWYIDDVSPSFQFVTKNELEKFINDENHEYSLYLVFDNRLTKNEIINSITDYLPKLVRQKSLFDVKEKRVTQKMIDDQIIKYKSYKDFIVNVDDYFVQIYYSEFDKEIKNIPNKYLNK